MVAGFTKYMMREVLNTTNTSTSHSAQAPATGPLSAIGRSNSVCSLGEQQNALVPLSDWTDAAATSPAESPKKPGFYWPPAAPVVNGSNTDEAQAAECLPTSTPAVSGAQLDGSLCQDINLGPWLDATTQRNTRSGCSDAAGIESLPELQISAQRKSLSCSDVPRFETLQTRQAAMRKAKHNLLTCNEGAECAFVTGGCRTARPSRPSSNESLRSCDTFAQFHSQQRMSMKCPTGDKMITAPSKHAAPSAHASRCPAPRAAKKSPRQFLNPLSTSTNSRRSVSPRNRVRRLQLAQTTSCPALGSVTRGKQKRSSPDSEEASGMDLVATPRKRIAVKQQRASSSVDLREHAHSQRMHDPHASTRQRHSWDGQKLTLPHIQSLSSESEETSAPKRCHSVLSMLCAQRSPASAALHSVEVESSDSEDDPESASQGAIRNISFLNLDYSRSRDPTFMNSREWSTRDSSVPAQWSEFKSTQRLCRSVGAVPQQHHMSTCTGYDSDEDLQSMPLLPADPPATPSGVGRHLEASGSFNRPSNVRTAPMTADGAADAALRRLEASGSFNKPCECAYNIASGAVDVENLKTSSRVKLQLKVVESTVDCMLAMHACRSPTAAAVVASIGHDFQDLCL